tara:strand:+ start:2721 stop:4310 length:1590 start_codon:yes stop_codon:yes gene_type:complete
MATDYSDEDFDQDQQQDIAAAAAQAAGINMDSYDFGDFDPGGSDTAGVSNKAATTGILNSYFNDPTKTGMAIRQSFPNFRSPRSGLNQFANLYTSRRGPMSRSDFNSLYDRTALNPGGINTLGYDTAKTLQRLGIGSGQIVNNPNAGRLTGTVFGKKNARGETILSSGGKSMGIDADKYYGGGSGSDVGRPDLETYQDKYDYANPNQRAFNRSYDSYINPRNNPDRVGYNRDVPSEYEMQRSAERGQVRPGLRSTAFTDRSGTPTALGPVATYDRDFSGADNIAMTLAPGGIGFLARALANPVSGIEGQAIPSAALAPTEEMLARGETSGGMMRSFNEALGQGIGALGDVGQGLMNAGTNIGDAFTNAVQNTAEALTNAGVNTAEAVDAAVRNTTEKFTNAGVNIADLFRSDPEPQVVRQLDDAPLDENMYGSGMFDLTAPLPQGAEVPRAFITRDSLGSADYIDDFRNRFEQSIDPNRSMEDANRASDRMLNELEQRQLESLERRRQIDAGTTFNQLPPNDVFNYFTR